MDILKSRLTPENYKRLIKIDNASLHEFVGKYIQLCNPDKVFVVDSGLANIAGFSFGENIGHYLENLVFNHYLAHNKKVYYWRNKGEVDFVVKEGLKVRELINVCYSLKDKEVLDREIESLKEAGGHFKNATKKIVFWEAGGETPVSKEIKMIPVLEL